MNDKSPAAGRGSSGLPGGKPSQGKQAGRTIRCDDELDLRWSTSGRCHAVLAELEAPLPDYETIACLMRGGAEDIEAAL